MQHGQITSGYSSAVGVTPSDSVPIIASALIVTGVAGNITIKDNAGNSILLTAVQPYVVIPINCTFVMATGTAATLIKALN